MNLSTIGFWIIRSSEDSKKWSSMVKGLAATVIPILAILNLDTSGFSDVFENLAIFAEYLALAITSGWAVWGAIRKVKTTILGTNAVLNDRVWE